MRYPQTAGFLLLIGLHGLFVLGLGGWYSQVTGIKPEASAALIGVLQLVYAIPVTLLLLKLRQPQMARGVVKGAIVTFLVNLAGCVAFLSFLSKIS